MARNIVRVGEWGGLGGEAWDDGNDFTWIKQIIIGHGEAINSIRIEYDRDGISVWGDQHGGDSGEKSRITLQPEELIRTITTHSNEIAGHPPVIRSLEFETNMRKLGPYGKVSGLRFSLPLLGGKIVGFFGHSGELVNSIGIQHSLPP